MANFIPPGNRNRNKFSKVEWDMLRQIHAEQERDLSGHVVDAKKVYDLRKEEEYIFEVQTEILKLYENVNERQTKVDKRIKKLRQKNSIGRFIGDHFENLETWDGQSKTEETEDEAIKALQQSALAIVQENWETNKAIDAGALELFELELEIVYKKVDKKWQHLKDLPPKKAIEI